ncbi:DNA methyltransferase [Pseudomonas phage DDSR119]|nr:DNA methyltransferase [Pseudomonas phage DDSR119]
MIGYSCCGNTRAAFEKYGHDVWTCDLLPPRHDSQKHLQMDVWRALEMSWDFAILHPMCTYLTSSAEWAYKDPDFKRYKEKGGYHQRLKPGTLFGADRRKAREEAVENFKRIMALPFPVVAENPARGALSTLMRGPDQVLHPYQAGDDASKATGLWRNQGDIPPLPIDPAAFVKPRMVCNNSTREDPHHSPYGSTQCIKCGSPKMLPRWANQTDSGQNNLSPGDQRWLDRSETYPGIAALLGDTYGPWLNRKVA